MLAELRSKSQITIPKTLVEKLGLVEGDKFEILEDDGTIYLVPVEVYPKKYIEELRSEINQVKAKLSRGDLLVSDSVEALFEKLESK
ncbi:MAG: AbrB/MazE/SpoVT family DNA-binding domain-containing protein [Anaerolineaceae bacterium]